MNSSTVCSQCVRAFRRPVRGNRLTRPSLHNQITSSQRSISSSSRILQQNVPDPRPYTEPPPITTGTVTANVTAAPPELTPTTPSSSSQKQPTPKLPDLSTSEMQKHLTSKLSRPRAAALTDTLAQKLRQTAKSTTESYITYGLTESFFKSCAAQAPYTIPEAQRTKVLTESGPPKTAAGEDLGQPEANTFWFRELGLDPTFSTWSQITYLHMYILTVRLRAMEDPKQFTDYQRYLIEHFSNAAEDKMVLLHSINARGIRNRYLKDLFVQWRGILAAYDEGMVKGDAVLAGAVWRNIWKGSEDVDWEKVAVVVAYMRRAVNGLAGVEFGEIAQNLDLGRKVWETARTGILNSVAGRSRGINEPM